MTENCIFPSVFCGESHENVEDWLLEYAGVAEANAWDDATKRLKVPAFLKGTALRWYFNKKTNITNWATFQSRIKEEFQPSDW